MWDWATKVTDHSFIVHTFGDTGPSLFSSFETYDMGISILVEPMETWKQYQFH